MTMRCDNDRYAEKVSCGLGAEPNRAWLPRYTESSGVGQLANETPVSQPDVLRGLRGPTAGQRSNRPHLTVTVEATHECSDEVVISYSRVSSAL